MMYSFDRTIIEFFLKHLISMYQKKYVRTMNKFIRERKMNQKEHMGYILTQRSCTGLY